MSALPGYAEQRRLLQVRDFTEAYDSFWASTGDDRAYWRDRLREAIASERRYLAEGWAALQATVTARRAA